MQVVTWPTVQPPSVPATRGRSGGAAGGRDSGNDETTVGSSASTSTPGDVSGSSRARHTTSRTAGWPRGSMPTAGGSSSTSTGSTAAPAPPGASPTSSSYPRTTTNEVGVPAGPIIWPVPVVVVFVVVCAVALIIYCCCRKHRKRSATVSPLPEVAVEHDVELGTIHAGTDGDIGSLVVDEVSTDDVHMTNGQVNEFEEAYVVIPLTPVVSESFTIVCVATMRSFKRKHGSQMGVTSFPVTSALVDQQEHASVNCNRLHCHAAESDETGLDKERKSEIDGKCSSDKCPHSVEADQSQEQSANDNRQKAKEDTETPSTKAIPVADRVKAIEFVQAGVARFYDQCEHGFENCGCLKKRRCDIEQ